MKIRVSTEYGYELTRLVPIMGALQFHFNKANLYVLDD